MWPTIWKSKVPLKLKAFMWKLVSDSIEQKITCKNTKLISSPQIRSVGNKKHVHTLIFRCNWTRLLWFGLLNIQTELVGANIVEDWLQSRYTEPNTSKKVKESSWVMCVLIFWYICKSKCTLVFEEKNLNPTKLTVYIS